jgi:hypothetical protein
MAGHQDGWFTVCTIVGNEATEGSSSVQMLALQLQDGCSSVLLLVVQPRTDGQLYNCWQYSYRMAGEAHSCCVGSIAARWLD